MPGNQNSLALAFLAVAVLHGTARGDVTFGETTVTYASVEEGKKILMERDDFVAALSPFDRAARLKSDKDVSEKEYLEFVGKCVEEWTEADKARVDAALVAIQPRLAAMALPFPKSIALIKTTGDEEGHAAYTRGRAIILPRAEVAHSAVQLQGMMAHELFHVLSRANPNLKEKAYAAIGFIKCDEVELPAGLAARKITNPDAPRNDHCIQLKVNGEPVWAVPVLISTSEKYNPARGGEFFSYLSFKLLLVERGEGTKAKLLLKGTEPRLLEMRDVSGFFEQVGRNTSYTIHPEEILADNFKLLVLGRSGPSADVLEKIREALGIAAPKP